MRQLESPEEPEEDPSERDALPSGAGSRGTNLGFIVVRDAFQFAMRLVADGEKAWAAGGGNCRTRSERLRRP